MRVIFTEEGLDEYFSWQCQDGKTIKRINALIKDIQRNGFMKGIGKPEALAYSKGFSRRIDLKNRLVYKGSKDGELIIISCKGHYGDK